MGADVTAANIHDSSVYHLACLNGNDLVLKELLYTHNIIMKVNSKGYHPIHYAAGCKRGQFCLEFLISLNIDVNLASFADGRTPLHVAALQGRTSCAQILYSNGKMTRIKCMFFLFLEINLLYNGKVLSFKIKKSGILVFKKLKLSGTHLKIDVPLCFRIVRAKCS